MLPLNKISAFPPSIQLLYFLLCLVVGLIGWNRTMGFWGYMFASVLFSPLIGLMLIIVSGKKAKGRMTDEGSQNTK